MICPQIQTKPKNTRQIKRQTKLDALLQSAGVGNLILNAGPSLPI